LLAVPLVDGRPLYQSYIVVWDEDQTVSRLTDLEGAIFAYSDPLSNSGYLFPQYVLTMLGYRPEAFFRRTFFTWSHRDVIGAVAAGLAEAGAVDGFVWEMLARRRPEITARTRVIERSPEFAFPPLVVSTQLPLARHAHLSDVFLHMHLDHAGRELLQELGLSGFAPGHRGDYDEILLMAEELRHA
jgi:phosphonate transport system substrate-binding protein